MKTDNKLTSVHQGFPGLKEINGTQERVWHSVSGAKVDSYWKPLEVGDVVEGKLSGSFEGNLGRVWLLDVDGKVVGLPSNVVLLSLLLKVPLGSYCRVTFDGSKIGESKKAYKSFKVEVAQDDPAFC